MLDAVILNDLSGHTPAQPDNATQVAANKVLLIRSSPFKIVNSFIKNGIEFPHAFRDIPFLILLREIFLKFDFDLLGADF